MFTGIVEARGRVRSLRGAGGNTRFDIQIPRLFGSGLKIGSSVSVSGVCLTVIKKAPSGIYFDLAGETLKRSTLGLLRAGDRVNLERPLKWRGRVEGHFVQGHVDGVGRVKKVISSGEEKNFLITFPGNIRRCRHRRSFHHRLAEDSDDGGASYNPSVDVTHVALLHFRPPPSQSCDRGGILR